MVQKVVDIGLNPDDGLGDPLREAFDKLNDNDAELYSFVPSVAILADGSVDFTGGQTFADTPGAINSGDYPLQFETGQTTVTANGFEFNSSTTLTTGDLLKVSNNGTDRLSLTGDGLLTLNVKDGLSVGAQINISAPGVFNNITGLKIVSSGTPGFLSNQKMLDIDMGTGDGNTRGIFVHGGLNGGALFFADHKQTTTSGAAMRLLMDDSTGSSAAGMRIESANNSFAGSLFEAKLGSLATGGRFFQAFADGTTSVFSVVASGDTLVRNLTIGRGEAGVDYTLTFDGETNDGVITFMEDEDHIKFLDDVIIADGEGLVIGHTEKVNFGATPELQVLGTDVSDSSMGFGRFSDNDGSADFRFLKSGSATIGGNTIVQDGWRLGRIRFQGADGTDFNTTAGEYRVVVDGSPAENDIPGMHIWSTRIRGGSLADRMFLNNAGNLIVSESVSAYDNVDVVKYAAMR